MRLGGVSAGSALIVVLALTLAAGTAQGTRGFEAGSRAVEITASGTVTFTALLSVRCPLTLSGIIDSQIAAVGGALVGLVRSGRVNEASCTGGTIALLEAESLYWPVRYRSFVGTWPRITSVVLDGESTALLGNIFGIGCLFGGTLPYRATAPEVTSITIDETATIPVVARLSASCPSSGSASGTLAISPTVRLRALEALVGHLVPINSNIRLPRENESATVRLENQGDENVSVETADVSLTITEGAARFSVDAASCARIAPRGVCDIRIISSSRPTSGRMTVRYAAGGLIPRVEIRFRFVA